MEQPAAAPPQALSRFAEFGDALDAAPVTAVRWALLPSVVSLVPWWLYQLGCRAVWGGVAGAFGLATVAHAQSTGELSTGGLLPPEMEHVLGTFGLPGAMVLLGWWGRGIIGKALDKIPDAKDGIPILVRLHEDDIEALRKALGRSSD